VADEYYGPTGAFRATETCDVAADIWSSAWMYRIEGDRSLGDGIERAFFNAREALVSQRLDDAIDLGLRIVARQ